MLHVQRHAGRIGRRLRESLHLAQEDRAMRAQARGRLDDRQLRRSTPFSSGARRVGHRLRHQDFQPWRAIREREREARVHGQLEQRHVAQPIPRGRATAAAGGGRREPARALIPREGAQLVRTRARVPRLPAGPGRGGSGAEWREAQVLPPPRRAVPATAAPPRGGGVLRSGARRRPEQLRGALLPRAGVAGAETDSTRRV
mmetsp:Transcript_41399/g.100488  ORF Transcript_41399/g.100488 Transcript_41399/m.100488 type:complete len:201 (+) Transcript_41399:894-1496(+)